MEPMGFEHYARPLPAFVLVCVVFRAADLLLWRPVYRLRQWQLRHGQCTRWWSWRWRCWWGSCGQRHSVVPYVYVTFFVAISPLLSHDCSNLVPVVTLIAYMYLYWYSLHTPCSKKNFFTDRFRRILSE